MSVNDDLKSDLRRLAELQQEYTGLVMKSFYDDADRKYSDVVHQFNGECSRTDFAAVLQRIAELESRNQKLLHALTSRNAEVNMLEDELRETGE